MQLNCQAAGWLSLKFSMVSHPTMAMLPQHFTCNVLSICVCLCKSMYKQHTDFFFGCTHHTIRIGITVMTSNSIMPPTTPPTIPA